MKLTYKELEIELELAGLLAVEELVLTQGLNRQIRRMSEALGYKVTELVRVRIMNIELGNLKRGEYRSLSDEELNELYEELKGSENAPGGRGR